ncbi:MAG: hypothetical protein EKK36_03750 [Bradyrhizobiaceae bacterium]|nr:MAG: hypothetical protein EKK36_03750 [Bradyrhizobiaceae bacterium]
MGILAQMAAPTTKPFWTAAIFPAEMAKICRERVILNRGRGSPEISCLDNELRLGAGTVTY